MKTLKTLSKGRYEAPVCDSVDFLQNCICSDSVGVTTDDYSNNGDFVW